MNFTTGITISHFLKLVYLRQFSVKLGLTTNAKASERAYKTDSTNEAHLTVNNNTSNSKQSSNKN